MRPLHWSHLRHFAESPAHYRYYLDHPVVATPAMKFGSLVHKLVLGVAPQSFVVYDGHRRGNAWKEFKEQHEGVEIVTAAEWRRASECADAIKSDPVTGPLVRDGLREHRMEWSVAGRPCAGTPDLNGRDVNDLKISAVVSPDRFKWHCRRMLWHAQLAWYADGVHSAQGQPPEKCHIIVCAPKPPFVPVAYRLSEETLRQGHETWLSLFHGLRTCEESDQWPGYAQEPVELDLDASELDLIIDGEEVTL